MSVVNESQHNDIAELLADYAIGALDDGDLWRVEAHLDRCARCQAELGQLLDLVGVLSPVASPDAAIKQALFQRAGLPLATSAIPIRRPAPQPKPPQSVSSSPPRPLRARPVWIALATAAVITLMITGGWIVFQQQQELGDQQEFVALLTDPEAAFPLTDSEVATEASATFYTGPDHDRALLVAQDLPSLDSGQQYQIWLFTESGDRADGGQFTPEGDGSSLTVVDPAEPISDYWAVGVSVEPNDGSDAPTSPLILGGWIQ